jgi:hypothetical protein
MTDCCQSYLTVTAISSSYFKVLRRHCKRSFPSINGLVAIMNTEP